MSIERAHFRIQWLVVKWCNKQSVQLSSKPKWVKTDRAQYMSSPPFVQHLIAFCSWPEAVNEVLSSNLNYIEFSNLVRLAVHDKWIKFGDGPLTAGGSFSTVISNFSECRPDVAGDVRSGMTIESVGMDVRAKFGDSRLNGGRIIRLFVRPDPFTHFCGVFSCILQPTGNS